MAESDWLKVMLGEIARKRAERKEAEEEEERRQPAPAEAGAEDTQENSDD